MRPLHEVLGPQKLFQLRMMMLGGREKLKELKARERLEKSRGNGWKAAYEAFGYEGPKQEREVWKRMAEEERKVTRSRVAGAKQGVEKRESRKAKLLSSVVDPEKAFAGIDEVDLGQAALWVYHNMAYCIREAPDGKIKCNPKRARSKAPSAGAISLMIWAAQHQKEFFTSVMPKWLGKKESGVDEREERLDEAGEILSVLEHLRGSA